MPGHMDSHVALIAKLAMDEMHHSSLNSAIMCKVTTCHHLAANSLNYYCC
uniref:Uncharacterized protein n=1 Tax=Rhizophora mucronata TaxID=61149 RepID=A0A2P2QZ78_RHIMU